MRRLKKSKPANNTPLPPFVPVREIKETPGELAANIKWLQANWQNYKGIWVALHKGELLCTGAEEQDLTEIVLAHPNAHNILCLLVGRDYSE